jgi:hypothetical protein
MKKTAAYQLATNFLLWLAFIGITVGFKFLRGQDLSKPFPTDTLTKFIDGWLVATVIISGFLVFGLFSIFAKRLNKKDDRRRSDEYAELALDEIASALYNFGSLLFACIVVGASPWYLLGTISCYWIGYYLKPHDAPLL